LLLLRDLGAGSIENPRCVVYYAAAYKVKTIKVNTKYAKTFNKFSLKALQFAYVVNSLIPTGARFQGYSMSIEKLSWYGAIIFAMYS
jgi:hypothetical protein